MSNSRNLSEPMPLAVTQREAARLLSVSTRTVYSLRDAGKLASIKLSHQGGRGKVLIPVESIKQFIAANTGLSNAPLAENVA
jgi:excisionase family DNA binding protein